MPHDEFGYWPLAARDPHADDGRINTDLRDHNAFDLSHRGRYGLNGLGFDLRFLLNGRRLWGQKVRQRGKQNTVTQCDWRRGWQVDRNSVVVGPPKEGVQP